MKFYMLDGSNEVKETDPQRWLQTWFRDQRQIAYTEGKIEVSTVFLGIDHEFVEGYQPVVFETMVSGGPDDGYCERYCTFEGAKEGHKRICKRVGIRNNPRVEPGIQHARAI